MDDELPAQVESGTAEQKQERIWSTGWGLLELANRSAMRRSSR